MSLSKIALSCCTAVLISSTALAGQLTLETGTSKPIRLKTSADAVVIGNPNIADVAVHNDQLLFITGKAYGTTNMIIFDADGNTVMSSDIVVTANATSWVSVNRGGVNFTYDCSPTCRPTMSSGDDPEHYQRVADQLLLQKELND
ncbi:MAG: pilus assembly protein N-terminal domain-containing protein [Pseudomonadota bacterium]